MYLYVRCWIYISDIGYIHIHMLILYIYIYHMVTLCSFCDSKVLGFISVHINEIKALVKNRLLF